MRCAISASIQHFMHFIKRKNCILTSRVAHFIIDVGCGAPTTHRRFYFVPLYATLAICTWICLTRRRAGLFRKNKKFLFVCHDDALRWIEMRCDYYFFFFFAISQASRKLNIKRRARTFFYGHSIAKQHCREPFLCPLGTTELNTRQCLPLHGTANERFLFILF